MLNRFIISTCMAIGVSAGGVTAQTNEARPNILVVLLDDAGFMDFGSYGSDTATPNIDGLTENGTAFSRFYATPLCGPSRAMLPTGQDNHMVGSGTLAEVLTPEMRALPGYNMTWQEDQATIATHLKSAGYQTFVTGKWGVGDIGANLPHRFGFDRSWVLDATGASNYAAKSYLPLYKEVQWFEDGQPVTLPEDFYSSRDIVDKMINYLDAADPDKPFFSYLPLMAVHLPVQVPRDYVDKYNGVFDRGWDVMRQERLERAVALGLVPDTATLRPPLEGHRDWDSLSEDEQAYWARAMQVNAGMMEAADFHLGRLLDHLENSGQLDNTIVVVTSDNGPEYNTLGKTAPPAMRAFERTWMAIEGWDVEFENLGQRGSHAGIGPEWATVSAAPFHLYKFASGEGGVRVPMIVSGPGIDTNGFVDARAMISDITPTLLDLADVPYDADDFYGRSLAPILESTEADVYQDDDAFAVEVSRTVALYRGNWKLARAPEPFGDGEWHLYDIASDPGETRDLGDQNPELLSDMVAEYQTYAKDVGVYELPPGQSARKQLNINAIKKTLTNYWYLPLGIVVSLLLVLFGTYRGLRWLFRRRPA